MRRGQQRAVNGTALAIAACVLAACGGSPAPRVTAPTTTTTTTTTAPAPTTTTAPGIAVPNVIGMKIALARFYLREVGLVTVPFNTACNKGSLASQSVAASLSVPGRPPNVQIGALPLVPGTKVPKGTHVGITWSGCYPNGTEVPPVTGDTFASAVHLLHLAGLTWACYSTGRTTTTTHPVTTTTRAATTTTSSGSTTSTVATTTTSTSTTVPAPPPVVLSQGTKAGTIVRAESVVDLVMQHCPQ